MIIGIDASRIEDTRKTGTENYAYEIVTRLLEMDNKNVYILYSRKSLQLELPSNAKNKVLRFSLLWTHIRLSLEMLFHEPDVLFVPAHTIPVLHPQRSIVIIHGLEYEYFPNAYSLKKRVVNKIGTYFSSRWAKIVITPSLSTKNDVVKFCRVNPLKVNIVMPGYNFSTSMEHKEPIHNREFFDTPYFIFVGRIEYRKNLLRVIKAFEVLKQKKHIPHRLVFVGKNGYGFESIHKEIENSPYQEDIRMLGYVEETEKQWLMQHAALFIFPTLREGFGFPILEAMGLGIPVVASNVGSVPEVAGESALLVNPLSIDEIAEAMYRIVSDNDLRQTLIEKGYENVKRFTWEKCVRKIFHLITSN